MGMPVISLNNGTGNAALPFMTDEQADEVFVFQDDLEFEPPENNGDSPTQTFLQAAGVNAKRYARGQFSWFLTLTPEVQLASQAAGVYGDWWTVSTVVCFQRNNLAALGGNRGGVVYGNIANNNSPGGPTSGFYTAGDSGGDVRIAWGSTGPLPKSGDWILLGRDFNGPTVRGVQKYEWYRIRFAGDGDLANPGLQDLSLVGADWPVPPGNRSRLPATTVTWMPEVVSVYSKRMRIEAN